MIRLNKILPVSACLFSLFALHSSLFSESALPLPPSQPLISGNPHAAFSFSAKDPSTATFTSPDAHTWRVATLRDTSPPYDIKLRAVTTRAVEQGDIALLHFRARTLSTADETGAGRMYIVVNNANGPNHNNTYDTGINFRAEWQEFFLPFKFNRNYPAGEAALMFCFGFMRQTVEVTGLEVLYYGKTQPFDSLPRTRFSYEGREDNAPWRTEALARIERLRKTDFTLRVTDATTGAPVSGARVRVEQTRSAFQWASALQFARLVNDTPDNRIYREKTLALFNAASPENDLKWPAWDGEWDGRYPKTQTLAALGWLRGHQFHTRGHVLVWPGKSNLPRSIQTLIGTPREKEIPALVRDHIRDITLATRGLIDEWDALNEPYTNHDLMDIFGQPIMADWFRTAAATLPGVPLFLNDFSNHDLTTDADHVAHFEKTTRTLLGQGAPLGGLGIQAHIGAQPNAPVEVLRVFDRYAAFGLPMRITEFDVWTDDEQLQADYTRDFLILCYSHPSIVGVQFWGFWEKAHWRPLAALFRNDWSERPAASAYRDLVLKKWLTRLDATTDTDGLLTTRGYQGDYLITVETPDGRRTQATLILRPGQPAPIVNLTLP